MKSTRTFVLIFAVAVTASLLLAEVNYDPESGGFAGRGDVLSVLATPANDKELVEAILSNVVFTWIGGGGEVWDVPCKKDPAGEGKGKEEMYRVFRRTSGENGGAYTVPYSIRYNRNGQITGYFLGPVPENGGGNGVSCPGGWEPDGAPELVEGEVGGGQLLVNGVPIYTE
jgi:hypothetical protein